MPVTQKREGRRECSLLYSLKEVLNLGVLVCSSRTKARFSSKLRTERKAKFFGFVLFFFCSTII